MAKEYEYLDLLERKLDEQQRQVCCRTDNSVVAAGAGSGKTQVLATRFAWLVMSKNIKASSILTLTFTNKAACEMYSRIYQTLKKFSLDERVPAKERKNAQEAVKDFANVHIQTLDSYCGGVVRQAANRYGIKPDFSTGSNDSSKNIQNLALPFVLKHRNNPAILYFSESGKLEDFANDFFAKVVTSYTSLADGENPFSKYLPIQVKQIIKNWNYYICGKRPADNFEPMAKPIGTYIDEIVTLINEFELEEKASEFKNIKKIFTEGQIPDFSIPLNENADFESKAVLDYVKQIQNWYKQLEKYKVQSRFSNENVKEAKSIFNDCLIGVFAEVIYPIFSYINQYKYVKELFRLLDEFTHEVNCQKRTSGALTFKDVTEMALKILMEQHDIRQQEKKSFNKIMIDEFQDNNGKNRDLLFLLAENEDECTTIPCENFNSNTIHDLLKPKLVKDKLFFVGDEKQSIYKFRGAEVSVFNELKNDFFDINGKDSFLHMVNNYRSTPELLSSFNQLFGGYKIIDSQYKNQNDYSIFSKNSEDSYEALYPEDSIALCVDKETHKPLEPRVLTEENISSHVAVLLKNDEFKDAVNDDSVMDSKEQLAFYIASKIKELHDSGEKFSSFAVLDKGRTDRHYLTRWLEKFQIPYKLDSTSKIFADAPVNDIYNFIKLCVYPSDLNAFSSFLCSPFAGLTEQALEVVLGCSVDITDSNFVFVPFDDTYDEIIKQKLSADEWTKYDEAKQFYKEQHQLVLSRPITDTINSLWYDKGYRYETLLNTSVNLFSEQYDMLFEIARSVDEAGQGIGWFIDQLAVQKNKEISSLNNEDLDLDIQGVSYPLETQDAVQIMTIHKSKGLQFNHVFIYGCMGQPSPSSEGETFFDFNTGLSVKPKSANRNFFYLQQKELINQMELAEYRRLIYVAVTRAVKDYYIVGDYSYSKDSISVEKNALLRNVTMSYYEDELLNGYPDIYFNEATPFDLEIITPVEKQILYDFSFEARSIDELRHDKIQKITPVMNNTPVIQIPVCEEKRISPSALENLVTIEEKSTNEANEFKYPEYNQINEIIDNTHDENSDSYEFGYNDFGTLVHAYMEYYVKNVPVEEIKLIVKNTVSNFLNLTQRQQDILLDICELMAKSFVVNYSQINVVETEYAFKMFLDDYLITGSIDLLYKDKNDEYVILDYKTDQAINPEIYYGQQSCYRKAVSEMYNIPVEKIKTYLYYTRFDKTVDISQNTLQNPDFSLLDSEDD